MKKIIASGDHHFHARSERWAECLRIHRKMAELVEREKPDVFLSAGDVYEKASTPAERMAVADWVCRIAEVCPVVIVRGNHDASLDLRIIGGLASRHEIIVEERAKVHVVNGIAIACMAWPSRSSLAAMVKDKRRQDEAEGAAMRSVLRGLGLELDMHGGLPRVLLMHAMFDGAKTSHGQPLIGQPLRVSADDLMLSRPDIAILGHIHKPQEWWADAVPILYTGSPFRTACGEVEQKSVVMAEFGNCSLEWERIPTPCQNMHLFEDSWNGETWDQETGMIVWNGVGSVDFKGSEVRFRYTVNADQRDGARLAAEEIKRELLGPLQCARVKVEEVVKPHVKARVPEIAQATTLEDKLGLLWKSSDRFDVSGTRATRVLGRLGGLQ